MSMTAEQRDIVKKLFDRIAVECARGSFLVGKPATELSDVTRKVAEMKAVLAAFEDALDLSKAATATLKSIGR